MYYTPIVLQFVLKIINKLKTIEKTKLKNYDLCVNII